MQFVNTICHGAYNPENKRAFFPLLDVFLQI